VWYEVKFEEPMWIKYMMDKYQITKTIGAKLATLIKRETFSGKNFYTPRSVDKAVNMLIHNVPTPYQSSILTILSESIKNPFEQEIDLGNGETLMSNEMISWIKLIQLKNKI